MGYHFSSLSERELVLTSVLLKYVKSQAQEFMKKKDGWRSFLELMDELIEIADNGLASSLISRLYQSV